jgi:L-arabinonolactonase
MTRVSVLPLPRSELGETPVWSAEEQALYWIDCHAPAIFCYQPASGQLTRWDALSGVEGLALRASGGVIAVLRTGIFSIARSLRTAELLAAPPGLESEYLVLHEARCDSAGRLWIGLMNIEPLTREPVRMSLYRLEGRELTELPTGVLSHVANGMAWNRAGTCLYLADSGGRTVWRFGYSVATGTLAEREVFAQFSADDGYPDGAAVDAEDGYWVAMAGSGKVIRLNPDGSRDRVIEVPSALPTAIAFGGRELDRMYVTSIGSKRFLPEVRRGQYDGCLFELDPGVRGLPEPRFRG